MPQFNRNRTPPRSFETAEKMLRIRENAVFDAGNPEAAAVRSSTEIGTTALFQSWLQKAAQRGRQALDGLGGRARACALKRDEISFSSSLGRLNGALLLIVGKVPTRMRPLIKEEFDASEALERFRLAEGIRSEPPWQPRQYPFWTGSFAATAAEAVPNTTMLAEGMELGWLGAFMMAWSFGLILGALACGIGFSRQLGWHRRWLGWLSGLVILAVVLGLVLGLGHIRSAIEANPIGYRDLAIQTLLSVPLSPLSDVKSLGVMAWSLTIVAAISLGWSHTFSTVPRYRELAIRKWIAERRSSREREDVMGEVASASVAGNSALGAQVQVAKVKGQAAEDTLAAAESIHKDVEDEAGSLAAQHEMAQRCYQEIWCRASHQPPPSRFSSTPLLAFPVLDSALLRAALTHTRDEVRALLAGESEARAQLADVVTRAQDAIDAGIEQLRAAFFGRRPPALPAG